MTQDVRTRPGLIAGAVVAAVLLGSEWILSRATRDDFPDVPATGEPTTVLVLGFASGPGPRANAVQRLRTRIAVRSVDPTSARFVFSGAAVHGTRSEAEVMAEYAVETLGVPRQNVKLEEAARNTWENVALSIPLLGAVGPIVIASDTLHARKARRYLWAQAPDLAARLVPAADYRFGEWMLLKPLLVAYQIGRAALRR